MTAPLEAFFLPVDTGRRFCIHHPPMGKVRGAILHVHAWAEEMNKSRRMVNLASRAMAGNGYAVLRLDLQGCGDSDGDFRDATWDGWIKDVRLGASWLRNRYPAVPQWMWAQRAGALIALRAADALPGLTNFLLWQPVAVGKTLLQQFLRLKAAAGLQQGDPRLVLEQARNDLAAGRPVEVAGYVLPPALALGLEQAQLDAPSVKSNIHWLETSTREPTELLPASINLVNRWRTAGHNVQSLSVKGPAFWQTQEIEDAPALVLATMQALQMSTAANQAAT